MCEAGFDTRSPFRYPIGVPMVVTLTLKPSSGRRQAGPTNHSIKDATFSAARPRILLSFRPYVKRQVDPHTPAPATAWT